MDDPHALGARVERVVARIDLGLRVVVGRDHLAVDLHLRVGRRRPANVMFTRETSFASFCR